MPFTRPRNLHVGFPNGISSEITERNPEMIPVIGNAAPFGFGQVVALFVNREDAELFVKAANV